MGYRRTYGRQVVPVEGIRMGSVATEISGRTKSTTRERLSKKGSVTERNYGRADGGEKKFVDIRVNRFIIFFFAFCILSVGIRVRRGLCDSLARVRTRVENR